MTLAWAATERSEESKRRTTNARIAGSTYLFYAAIGIWIELLMYQARGVDGGAAELVRIGQYATNVRLSILVVVLESVSALVLGVTLYGITRVEDHALRCWAWCVALPKACSVRSESRTTWDCCGWRSQGAGRARLTSPQQTRCVHSC